MAKDYFMPRADADKALWLQNFASKLPTYAAKYGIDGNDLNDMAASAAAFTALLNYRTQYDEFLKKITSYKNAMRDGIPSGTLPPSPLVVPNLPVPQGLVPGIFVRATALANVIKGRSGYTEADGNDLGIEGTAAAIDLNGMKPAISLRLIAGGHPELVWAKAKMDGIEIHKDSGDGNWQLLAYDAHPNYTDNSPLPAAGQSAVWKYKCIYRYNDEQAGQWSDVASIAVHSA